MGRLKTTGKHLHFGLFSPANRGLSRSGWLWQFALRSAATTVAAAAAAGGRELDFGRRSYFSSTFLSSDTQSVPPPQPARHNKPTIQMSTQPEKAGNHSNFQLCCHSPHLVMVRNHVADFHSVQPLLGSLCYFLVLFALFGTLNCSAEQLEFLKVAISGLKVVGCTNLKRFFIN